MFKKIIVSAFILISAALFAHEGHDQTPGAIKSNHGGVVKAGKFINLEYVVSNNEIKLFPATHDGKDLSISDVKLTVSSKLPKGKSEVIKTESKDGVTIAKVNFKSAYRIEMTVDAEVKGQKSTFKFQVEK
jgi:hypothetical protein